MAALIAAGYTLFPAGVTVQGRHGVSGAKSDGGDVHLLADEVRSAAGDSAAAGVVKVLVHTHKTLIWERAAIVQRLRAQLLEYSAPR